MSWMDDGGFVMNLLPPALLVTCRLSDSPHVRRWLAEHGDGDE